MKLGTFVLYLIGSTLVWIPIHFALMALFSAEGANLDNTLIMACGAVPVMAAFLTWVVN